MAKKTKSPTLGGGMGSYNSNKIDDTSLPAQRQRLLVWLREHPVNTLEARHVLNILAPAPRIHELRHRGFNIVTYRVEAETPEGKKHRGIAKYVLLSARNEGGDNDKTK